MAPAVAGLFVRGSPPPNIYNQHRAALGCARFRKLIWMRSLTRWRSRTSCVSRSARFQGKKPPSFSSATDRDRAGEPYFAMILCESEIHWVLQFLSQNVDGVNELKSAIVSIQNTGTVESRRKQRWPCANTHSRF